MNTLQLVQDDLGRVSTELTKVQQVLRETNFPEGNLIFKRFKDHKCGLPYVRIYSTVKDGKSKKYQAKDRYIPLHERELAKKLALKKYYMLKEMDLREEFAALSAFRRCFKTSKQRADQLLRKYPEVYALIKDEVNDLSVKAKRWSEEAYIGKKNYEEELIHETIDGHRVRSKSEVLIANELYYAGVSYRYECQHMIGGVSFYPDFTVLNPRTGRTLIWEHFGLAAKRDYMSETVGKLAHYAEHGLIHGRNFIMTYESERTPLSVATVRLMIETYLK